MARNNTLVIQHTEGEKFRVLRGRDLKLAAETFSITPPAECAVEGRPQSNLARELRWYLEWFLDYPFPPETDHADAVLRALHQWGETAFTTLFHGGQGRDFYQELIRHDAAQRLLQVSSDDPRVLAWPWEALRDPQLGPPAQLCRIERRLNAQHDPPPLRDLPQDGINILLVTARPYEDDVHYRSISRPIVDLIDKEELPARVTLLRPPTLDQLRAHLQERPNYYHIVHFDGHGAYGVPQDRAATEPAAAAMPLHNVARPQGYLVFEDRQGTADLVSAQTFSTLLHEHHIPAVVLNACQSATLDDGAENAFASVAGALLQAGVRSVTAMAYSVYVSAATQFLPAFYQRLFASGEFSEAVRAGRQQLLAHKERICARGRYPLEDWLVPVLYQQDQLSLPFRPTSEAPTREEVDARRPALPNVYLEYGFIGRDGPILELERALHRPFPVLLLNGAGGVGKTTLAYGFAQWLQQTEGLEGGVFWFDFREILAAESVINRIGEAFLGGDFSLLPLEKRVECLANVLQVHRSLIVWDNFEVVWGVAGTSLEPRLPDEDRRLLSRFARSLAEGKTKLLITSRSAERWLERGLRFKLSVEGLSGEERWEFCESVLAAQGKKIDRDDPDLVALMKLLGGHPLAMRVMLPELQEQSANSLLQRLEQDLQQFAVGDVEGDERQLFATLAVGLERLPPPQRPLLLPLALHEQFVDGELLTSMAQQVDFGHSDGENVLGFLEALCGLGLLTHRGGTIYELHPLVTRYLRTRQEQATEQTTEEHGDPSAQDVWRGVFVHVMWRLATELAPAPLHEQQGPFAVHEGNFHNALVWAERLELDTHATALSVSLGAYAQNTRNFAAAQRWYQKFLATYEKLGNESLVAGIYHQLGIIGQEQRDFVLAEEWYRKSLAIWEKLGDEHLAAKTYHNLGMIAVEQRDFVLAEEWYRKSLAVWEKLGDEHGAASTYHQLGRNAEEQRDFGAAEEWYRKSLAIEEELGNEHGAAITYHCLGSVAFEERDFAAAEEWYRKSLAIWEKLGVEHDAAATHHQLGMIAQEQGDFVVAEEWYRKSLAISEKSGNEHYAAITYHQLGRIAQEYGDFAAAEEWYRKSVAISEKLRDEHGAATTYHNLGNIARNLSAAEVWYRKSLAIKEKLGDEHGAASTYHQLGMIAEEQSSFQQSLAYYERALEVFYRYGDQHSQLIVLRSLARLWHASGDDDIPNAVAGVLQLEPSQVEELFRQLADNSDE